MKNSKNKYLWLPFFTAALVTLIFIAAQIPMVNINPENLPIALVNEDTGEMGETILTNLKEKQPDAVNFIEYDSVAAMKDGMKDRDTYGGLVIPADFSDQLSALQAKDATPANLELYVNEGVNANLATTMETVLKEITAQINSTVSEQVLVKMQEASEQMGTQLDQQLAQMQQMNPTANHQEADISTMISPVQPDKVEILANPVDAKVTKVNQTGDLASAPTALLMPLWIASLMGTVMFYNAGKDRPFQSERNMRKFQLIQSLMPIMYGLFAGHLVTWYSTTILGYEYISFETMAIFSSIAVIAFVYMILSVVSWLKLPSLIIFMLFVFFGLPLIQLVPEMIPSFYGEYILPWIPIRFLVDGIKEILFFGGDVMNSYTKVLIGIGLSGFALLWLKNLVMKPLAIGKTE